MPLQRTQSEFFDLNDDSSDLAALVEDLDDEFSAVVDSLVARQGEEEEEEEFHDAEEGVYLDQLFGDDEEEEEEDKEEEDKEEDEEWFDSEEGEFGSSLLPDDVSACSEMSIDMEEYGGIDGSAVAGEVQVGGNSGCGWYPLIEEDIMMEEDVEIVDANEGKDVVMEEAFVEEDVEMEEAVDWMDVDDEFCYHCHYRIIPVTVTADTTASKVAMSTAPIYERVGGLVSTGATGALFALLAVSVLAAAVVSVLVVSVLVVSVLVVAVLAVAVLFVAVLAVAVLAVAVVLLVVVLLVAALLAIAVVMLVSVLLAVAIVLLTVVLLVVAVLAVFLLGVLLQAFLWHRIPLRWFACANCFLLLVIPVLVVSFWLLCFMAFSLVLAVV
ncbi:hypothetical protein V8B55DRAFT_1444006 [Mucor lusitanicus]|uniref:ABC transmembrane type-1 domain-containing protein n=1 Tax=Mucor circinelloides f. lusitanicus TaxID=29924 RepID=A0A8H4F1K8_MUCCL|nr:hypothetical protein FB192DRAFT_1446267 [Mucor lusitanicus]